MEGKLVMRGIRNPYAVTAMGAVRANPQYGDRLISSMRESVTWSSGRIQGSARESNEARILSGFLYNENWVLDRWAFSSR
jgi:hypothetical protein